MGILVTKVLYYRQVFPFTKSVVAGFQWEVMPWKISSCYSVPIKICYIFILPKVAGTVTIWNMMLTTHLHLMQQLRMTKATPLLPLHMYSEVLILQVPIIQGSVQSKLMCCSQNHFHAQLMKLICYTNSYKVLSQFQSL